MKEDTITLVASYGADRAEHAVLIADEADKHGKATVNFVAPLRAPVIPEARPTPRRRSVIDFG